MADLRQDSSVFGELLVTGGGASTPVHVTGGDVDAGTDYDLLKIHDVGSGTVLRLNNQSDGSLFQVDYTGTEIGGSFTLPHSAPAEGQILTRATGAGAGVLSWENIPTAPFTADLDDVLNNTTGNFTTQSLTTGAFKATSINVNSAFSFPTADGTSGQVLQTNGSGVVTWAAAGGGTDDQTLDEVLTEGSTSTQSATLGGLTFETTVADGSDPEQLVFRNTSASPAASDVIGSQHYYADNAVGAEIEYAAIEALSQTINQGGEKGELVLKVRGSGGALKEQVKVNGVVSFYDDAYSFPIADGSANQALFTNGSGIISWTESIALLLAPTAAGSGQIPMTVAGSWYPSFWTLPTAGGTTGHVLTMTGTGVSGWQAATAATLDAVTTAGSTTTNDIEVGTVEITNDAHADAALAIEYTDSDFTNPVGLAINSTNDPGSTSDALPVIYWSALNSASAVTSYGGITCVVDDSTSGLEDSSFELGAMVGGTFKVGAKVEQGTVRVGVEADGTDFLLPTTAGNEGEVIVKNSDDTTSWGPAPAYAVEILSFDQTTNAARYIPWGSRAESSSANALQTSTFACTHDTIIKKIALRFESDPGACTIRVEKLTTGAGATTLLETISFTPSTTVGEINVVSFTSASTLAAGEAFLLKFDPTNVPNDVTGSVTMQIDPTS